MERLPPLDVDPPELVRERLVLLPPRGAVPQVERVEHHSRAGHERVRVLGGELGKLKLGNFLGGEFLLAAAESVAAGALTRRLGIARVALPQGPQQPVRARDPRLGVERYAPHVVLLFSLGVVHRDLPLLKLPLALAPVPGQAHHQGRLPHLPRRIDRAPRYPDVDEPVLVPVPVRHGQVGPPVLGPLRRLRVGPAVGVPVQPGGEVNLGADDVALGPAHHPVDGVGLQRRVQPPGAREHLHGVVVAKLRKLRLYEIRAGVEELGPEARVSAPGGFHDAPTLLQDIAEAHEGGILPRGQGDEILRGGGCDGLPRGVVDEHGAVHGAVVVRDRRGALAAAQERGGLFDDLGQRRPVARGFVRRHRARGHGRPGPARGPQSGADANDGRDARARRAARSGARRDRGGHARGHEGHRAT